MSTFRRTGVFVLALAAGLAVAPCLAAQQVGAAAADSAAVPAAARATIDSVNADWIPALQRRDAAAIAAPYADDGVLVTATGESVRGRAAVEAAMRASLDHMGTAQVGGRLVQDGLTRAGNLLYEWGHAELEISGGTGAPTRVTGRYLTVWRQDATGRWRILRNLSLP
ncbi:MAG TPA: SgcJ/EcaC family oxidoreductase [Longimicrobiaceae bacterium]|nr:SgcJ/EcaC family oxidoreductase [Longimicrobiaceae bacterium]